MPAAVAFAVAALLAVGGCSSSSSPTSSASSSSPSASSPATSGGSTSSSTGTNSNETVVDVTVSGGSVVGGVQRKSIEQGATVVLRVTSDVADEVHVHGYDKKADVEAGGSVDVRFTADLGGVFEAELESAHLTLVELEVS